jgi:two-component system alkaline phosphatase synthesis response regulator PhoP
MARILVVEDEPYIALGLKSDLVLEGYEVEVARDGQAAFDRAGNEPFDLILLDVMLPRKDGLAVCRELRHRGVRTPIIMLTAKTQEAEKVLGLELGADDYVTKPFSPLELRARVRAVLRRVSGEPPEVYRFGDVEVDFTRAEVRRRGTVVVTSALEFKLLTAFIRRRGRLLTREQLLDAAWGPDDGPTDRAIDNHVMNLRRKIEPRPDRPTYLVSVRGLGYRFDG